MIDPEFLRIAQERLNPYRPTSGTEHVAFLLYSLVRMTRPRVVVEFGSGYTTLFLLRALADNLRDFREERIALLKKSRHLFDSADATLLERLNDDPKTWDDEVRYQLMAWLMAGGKACNVDPKFYLTSYTPHLFSFEKLSPTDKYVMNVREAIRAVQHEDLFTHLHGKSFSSDALPPHVHSIDLAWNDDAYYREFFDELWPRLNPAGGLMIFHNVAGSEAAAEAVEWIVEQRAAAKDLEVLTLEEPHKLNQNSCAILRRVSIPRPRFALAHPQGVLRDLRQVVTLADGESP